MWALREIGKSSEQGRDNAIEIAAELEQGEKLQASIGKRAMKDLESLIAVPPVRVSSQIRQNQIRGTNEMTVMIVGGTPGAGKSTVAAWLAKNDPCGVHLKTDFFFDFISHKLDPSKPESRQQNQTLIRAYLAAAQCYVEAGYSVFIDGVIGPWSLPEISKTFEQVDYAILHAVEQVTLDRLASRPAQASARPSLALRMHKQFEEILQDHSRYVLHTDDAAVENIANELLKRRAAGELLMARMSI